MIIGFGLYFIPFYRYFSLFISDGLPLAAFHRSLERCASFTANSCPVVSYKLLRKAWAWFLDSLKVESKSRFKVTDADLQQLRFQPQDPPRPCEECGPFPKTLVLDGTCLGFRKEFLSQDTLVPDTSIEAQLPVTGISYSERIAIAHTKTRRTLRSLADKKDLPNQMFRQLQHELSRTFPGSVIPMDPQVVVKLAFQSSQSFWGLLKGPKILQLGYLSACFPRLGICPQLLPWECTAPCSVCPNCPN